MRVRILQACLMLDRICVINDVVDFPQNEADALIRGGVAEPLEIVESVIEPVERTAVKPKGRKVDKWRNQS